MLSVMIDGGFVMTAHTTCSFADFLTLQRVSPRTADSYLRAVKTLADYHKQSPSELSNDQIQDFLIHSIQEKKLAWSSCNVLFCGFKKFYQEYLGRSDSEFSIPPRTRCKKIPMLLSRQEVWQLLEAPTSLKHRVLLWPWCTAPVFESAK